MAEGKHFDLNAEFAETHAFIQWKGTDVCLDFYCDCGEAAHFDGYFAYALKCHKCGTVWQMPTNLFPRRTTDPREVEHAQLLQPDEAGA